MRPIFHKSMALSRSKNPLARQCHILGTVLDDNSPLLVDEHSLSHGLLALGIPGSGKTAIIEYLMESLLSRGPCDLDHFDLKDPPTRSTFETVRIGAARSGIPFKWFVDEVGRHTHTFNIFKQEFWYRLTPMQKASIVGFILGVTHGLEGYGKGFHGGNHYAVLLKVFKHYEIRSWVELYRRIQEVLHRYQHFGLTKETKEKATELVNAVERFAEIPALNTDHSSIDLCSPEPRAIAWAFPSAYDLAGGIARMGMIANFEAARMRKSSHRKWLVGDEVQRALGESTGLLFSQSREKFGLILATQCLAELKIGEKDFREIAINDLRLRLTFNITDAEEIQRFAGTSGKVLRERYAYGVQVGTQVVRTRSWTEYEADRLGINDVRLASATPGLAMFVCNQNHAFLQYGSFPQIIKTEFHIDPEEYRRRSNLPWPGPEDGTMPNDMPPIPPSPDKPPQLPGPAHVLNPPNTEQTKPPRRAPKNPRP